jgi:HD-GYP domain-containing protein (c-di-GMP phosphodiesterase class II)
MAKPGILNVEELEVLRQHPSFSREIIAGIPGLEEVAEWVSAHHERPDGRGYPEGFEESEIPLEARILAIADAYVAVTSDRPHRRGVNREDGVRILSSAAGTQLDGALVDLFVEKVVA